MDLATLSEIPRAFADSMGRDMQGLSRFLFFDDMICRVSSLPEGIFTERVFKQWNRLPKEAINAPNLSVFTEIFEPGP